MYKLYDPLLWLLGINVNMLNEGREIVLWKKIKEAMAVCLNDHDLFVGYVTEEASIRQYDDHIYRYIHLLAKHLKITLNEFPRLHFIVGPVINVSTLTGKSVIIELFKEGLLNLYYSEYRQPVHFRIGGWDREKRTGKPTNINVCIEKPHSPLAPIYTRKAILLNQKIKSHQAKIKKMEGQFQSLIESKAIQKIANESELNKFIFLTTQEQLTLNGAITEYYKRQGIKTKKLFGSEMAEELNANLFMQLLNKAGIKLKPYGVPRQSIAEFKKQTAQ